MALIVSFDSKNVDPMLKDAKLVPKCKATYQYFVTSEFFIDCNGLSEAFDQAGQSG